MQKGVIRRKLADIAVPHKIVFGAGAELPKTQSVLTIVGGKVGNDALGD
jgi:hypothetical protein